MHTAYSYLVLSFFRPFVYPFPLSVGQGPEVAVTTARHICFAHKLFFSGAGQVGPDLAE